MLAPSRPGVRAGAIVSAVMVLGAVIFFAAETAAVQDKKKETSAAPITNGQRVFTCGHSFHVWVPGIVTDLCKMAKIPDHVQIGVSSIGGSQVIQHWNIAEEKNRAKEALKTGKVDVLTLSPIFLPDAGIENFTRLALEHNKDIRIVVQPIWLRWDIYEPTTKRPKKVDHNAITGEELRKRHAVYFKEMDAYIRELNRKQGKTVLYVVPAAQAVIALREKIIAGQAPGLKAQKDLFTDELGHGTAPLQALVGYCNYAVIYRRSPVGLPVPGILKQSKLGDQEDKLNRLLQELAWEAVVRHPLSGVRSDAQKPAKQPAKKSTFLDPKEAGLDYEIQGEYTGTFASGDKLGCQIIALGNGHFQAVLLPGGLPGDGWNGADKYLMDGKLDSTKASFEPTSGKRKYMAGSPKEFSAFAKFPPKGNKEFSGEVVDGVLTGKSDDGAFTLKKIVRSSPTSNAKPPEGALVLFDGSNADEWKEGKIVDGLLPVEANSKRKFKDFRLHIEFRTPFQPTARSQGRGNSGVYLHARHEIQVLDSFGLEGRSDECGGFYGRKPPSVNMCYPPLTWQTYDVEWKSEPANPKSKKQMARVTVLHNGVKIHDNLEFPSGEGHFHLQNHGNPVFYRNIWVVELK